LDYFQQMKKDAPEPFPWRNWMATNNGDKDNRPDKGGDFIRVKAASRKAKKRWAFAQVLLSSKGSCRLTQIAAYTKNGQLAPCEFHVSVYFCKNAPQVIQMPSNTKKGGEPTPFFTGAFESINPETGIEWSAAGDDRHMPHRSLNFHIGWGNKNQPAGYSPGRKSDGAQPTGMLVDEAAWHWDFTRQADVLEAAYAHNSKDVKSQHVSCWLAFYAEYTEDVYFIGRFYRQEPGGY
jgi:hypothetical protein